MLAFMDRDQFSAIDARSQVPRTLGVLLAPGVTAQWFGKLTDGTACSLFVSSPTKSGTQCLTKSWG